MNAALPWPQIEEAVRGIFARRYYANNGPLVRELDASLAQALGMRHAICVANADWALKLLTMAVPNGIVSAPDSVAAVPPVLIDGRAVAPFQVDALGAAFSLQSLGAGEGGFIVTDDDDLAARLRTMRNFHPSETFAAVDLRTNAKMSEMQAALGLIALEQWQAPR